MSARSDALVLFGATGDLARKMLYPALHRLAETEALPPRVVGVASSDWSVDRLVEYAHDSIEASDTDFDAEAFARLADRMDYVSGDYRNLDTFERLHDALGGSERPLAHLAIPPSLFETVADGLASVGLNRLGRVIVEKPFGRDLDSARELNRCLLDRFPDDAVFRMDHFLGKEEVLDLLVFRFANPIFDPAWNRDFIDSVQVTMAESFGVHGRGHFYEEVGALRDVVQNHLLQILTLVAMEIPADAGAEALRTEKVRLLSAMKAFDPASLVRGQFEGYRDEEGVASDSEVETFVALRAEIDNPRWSGVPFFIRTGKEMATTLTEVVVEFKRPERVFFSRDGGDLPHPNHLRFRLKPAERFSLSMQIKRPGEDLYSFPADMVYDYDERRDGPQEEAYARLLDSAMDGDPRLFASTKGVEEAWRVVDPVLTHPSPVLVYPSGSWGPPEADRLIADHGGWHAPDHDTDD